MNSLELLEKELQKDLLHNRQWGCDIYEQAFEDGREQVLKRYLKLVKEELGRLKNDD